MFNLISSMMAGAVIQAEAETYGMSPGLSLACGFSATCAAYSLIKNNPQLSELVRKISSFSLLFMNRGENFPNASTEPKPLNITRPGEHPVAPPILPAQEEPCPLRLPPLPPGGELSPIPSIEEVQQNAATMESLIESHPKIGHFLKEHVQDFFPEEISFRTNDSKIHRKEGGWKQITGGGQKHIYAHEDFPEYVFKFSSIENLCKTIQNYVNVKNICIQDNLDLIVTPDSILVVLDRPRDESRFLLEKKEFFLMERNLPISWQSSIKAMKEMRKHHKELLHEMLRQKTILAYKAKLTDIKLNNFGISEDCSMVLVDADSTTQYWEREFYTLIQVATKEEIEVMHRALFEINPDLEQHTTYAEMINWRHAWLAQEMEHEKFKEKYQNPATDPLVVPLSSWEKLTSTQKIIVKVFIDFLNEKIAKQHYDTIERNILVYIDEHIDLQGKAGELFEENGMKDEIPGFAIAGQNEDYFPVDEFLIKEGIIFKSGQDPRPGHVYIWA